MWLGHIKLSLLSFVSWWINNDFWKGKKWGKHFVSHSQLQSVSGLLTS